MDAMDTCDYEVIRNGKLVRCGAPAATIINGIDWQEVVCLPHAMCVRQEVLSAGSAWAGTDSR